MYFTQDEYERRWRRVLDEMRARNFDWALIWGRSGGTYERCNDVLYLSNYYSSQSGHEYDSQDWMGVSFSAMLIGHDDVPEMVVDEPDYPPDLLPLPTSRVRWETHLIEGAARMVRARRISRVALVGTDFLPMKYAQLLKSLLPDVEFVEADDLVREVRKSKSSQELECYREIGEKVTAAMDVMVKAASKGGVTQAEVAALGTAELMRRGGVPHMVPVSNGPTMFQHCGDPLLGFSPNVILEKGDMVRLWIYGPAYQGYWSDPGRTVIVGGRGTARQRKLIENANKIITTLMEEIRPGRKLSEIAVMGNQMRASMGTEEDQPGKMWPIYGHGVGLFWEDPWLTASSATPSSDDPVFHEGQTYSTETFLHWPDVGSAGVEQNFIVHEGGNELLTTTDLINW